jgi:hypothetical protein
MVKIQLPNGTIIERKPFARALGNFCQLYARYNGNVYAIGNGDEYMHGMPNVFRLDHIIENKSKHFANMQKISGKRYHDEKYGRLYYVRYEDDISEYRDYIIL